MIKVRCKNNIINNTSLRLKKLKEKDRFNSLDRYGREGVESLKNATPKDSGETADSWDYKIIKTKESVKIIWTNSNIQDGYSVAILIQYGHATKSGTFVQGIDYISPAMKPIFKNIAKRVWEEVTQ